MYTQGLQTYRHWSHSTPMRNMSQQALSLFFPRSGELYHCQLINHKLLSLKSECNDFTFRDYDLLPSSCNAYWNKKHIFVCIAHTSKKIYSCVDRGWHYKHIQWVFACLWKGSERNTGIKISDQWGMSLRLCKGATGRHMLVQQRIILWLSKKTCNCHLFIGI